MKAASISEIKKELQNISEKELAGLCLRLAKYKKENKEFLGYLLFDAISRDEFIKNLKKEINEYFLELKLQSNLYYVKKGLRKILRVINRYCKFMDDKEVTAGLIIHFCNLLIASGISWKKNKYNCKWIT